MYFDQPISDAVEWLRTHISDSAVGSGWGWVPDVPPNPQNTAEVVCALLDSGQHVPKPSEVAELLGLDEIPASRAAWLFQTNMDVAWRLKALVRLRQAHPGLVRPEPVKGLADVLLTRQGDDGGWGFAPNQATSIATTAHAVEALAALDSVAVPAQRLRAGASILKRFVHGWNPEKGVANLALALRCLCVLRDASLLRATSNRFFNRGAQALLRQISVATPPIEQEFFYRGDVLDCWRHLGLPLALETIVRCDANLMFEPVVRSRLADLVDLQEREGIAKGAVRTSREGFATSYATTLFVSCLALMENRLQEANQALLFDAMCLAAGVHKDDPRVVFELRGRKVVLNVVSAFLFSVLVLVGAATLLVLSVPDFGYLPVGLRKALVVEGLVLIATAVIFVLHLRFTSWPLVTVAVASYSAMTGIALPLLVWVLE